MVSNPFIYGEEVRGTAFWNRKKEIAELMQDVRNGQNVIIFSNRRYGKTSLVKTVLDKAKKSGVLTVYVDLYPAISKDKFVDIYARAISATLGKPSQKILEAIKKLFPKIIPKLVIGAAGDTELEFDYSYRDAVKKNLGDVLQAVHHIALKQKKPACVVFDEFQEIAAYGDSEVEKQIRSAIQDHRHISYIFMGSKKHLFQSLFHDANRPLYKSGKHFPLQRLPLSEASHYAQLLFRQSRFSVAPDVLERITTLGNGHPYYTQQLCHILWDQCLSRKKITSEDVDFGLAEMLGRESKAYETTLDNLSPKQKRLLTALSIEPTSEIFASGFLTRHHLGSASSIQKAFGVLVEKDIVEKINGTVVFQDPFLGVWLQQNTQG